MKEYTPPDIEFYKFHTDAVLTYSNPNEGGFIPRYPLVSGEQKKVFD